MTKETLNPENTIKTFSVGNIELSIHQEFKQLATDKGINQRQLFLLMFDNYKNMPIDFNADESLIIREAQSSAATYFNKKIKKHILKSANEIVDAKNSPKEINLHNKSSAKSADARVDTFINEMLKHNENATNSYDKIHINKTSIFDYAKKQKQVDANNLSIGKVALERGLLRNKELIDLHNAEHNLSLEHNLYAYHQRAKANKTVS